MALDAANNDEKSTSTPSGLQVVACGLPRTGTTTIGRALAILLDGPVFDGISDTFLHGNPTQQEEIVQLSTFVPDDPASFPIIKQVLTSRLPYKATTDAPFNSYVSELLTLYPDLKFVCTVRPFEAWYASFINIQRVFTLLAPYAWLWPSLRRCVKCMENSWKNRLRHSLPTSAISADRKLLQTPVLGKDLMRDIWESHVNHVEMTVPKGQLLMYDVRDGWKPLCKFLGKEVPTKQVAKTDGSGDLEEVELEFPHEFGGKSLNNMREDMLRMLRGRLALVMLAVCSTVGLASYYYMLH